MFPLPLPPCLKIKSVRKKEKMKENFQPPFKFCMQLGTQGGMHKNALFEGGSTLVAMVTTAACSRPGVSFSYKNVEKKKE